MATVRYVYGQHETLLTTDFEDSPVPRVDEFVYLEVPKDRLPPRAVTRESDGKAYMRVRRVTHDPEAGVVRVGVWPVLG